MAIGTGTDSDAAAAACISGESIDMILARALLPASFNISSPRWST
jgi:hypothetical protein